jgi:hypothetical protein
MLMSKEEMERTSKKAGDRFRRWAAAVTDEDRARLLAE